MPAVCEDAPCCGCCGSNGDDAEQWTGARREQFDAEFYNFGGEPDDYDPDEDDYEDEDE